MAAPIRAVNIGSTPCQSSVLQKAKDQGGRNLSFGTNIASASRRHHGFILEVRELTRSSLRRDDRSPWWIGVLQLMCSKAGHRTLVDADRGFGMPHPDYIILLRSTAPRFRLTALHLSRVKIRVDFVNNGVH